MTNKIIISRLLVGSVKIYQDNYYSLRESKHFLSTSFLTQNRDRYIRCSVINATRSLCSIEARIMYNWKSMLSDNPISNPLNYTSTYVSYIVKIS